MVGRITSSRRFLQEVTYKTKDIILLYLKKLLLVFPARLISNEYCIIQGVPEKCMHTLKAVHI